MVAFNRPKSENAVPLGLHNAMGLIRYDGARGERHCTRSSQRLEHITIDRSRASRLPAADRYPIIMLASGLAWVRGLKRWVFDLLSDRRRHLAWERGLCASVPHVDLDRDEGTSAYRHTQEKKDSL